MIVAYCQALVSRGRHLERRPVILSAAKDLCVRGTSSFAALRMTGRRARTSAHGRSSLPMSTAVAAVGGKTMNEQQLQPQADRAWAIESYGIEPIADSDRHGRPFELFWVWFAANIGILGIVYGGILTAAGLNLWQSILVALVAP